MINITQELKRAQFFYKSFDYSSALNVCSEILRLHPNNSETLGLMGVILNKVKNFQQALSCLEQALKFHHAKHAILTEIAVSKIGLYLYDDAKKLIEESLVIQPNYDKSHIQMAIIEKKLKNPIKAEAILKKWIEQKPNSISAINNLANLLTEQGRISEAEVYFKKTIEVDPNNARAYSNLGYFEVLQNNLNMAEEYIKKSVELAPRDSFGIAKLGYLTAIQGHPEKGIEMLVQALNAQIVDSEIFNTIGRIFLMTGEFNKARNALRKSLEIMPDNAETLAFLGRVYSELSSLDKAAAVLEKAIELNPYNEEPKVDLSNVYQLINKDEEAFVLLNELYDKNPSDTRIFFSLARLNCNLCHWDNRNEIELKMVETIDEILNKQKDYPFQVFNFNYYNISPELHLKANKSLARFYEKQIEGVKKRISLTHNWDKKSRLRIGYISPDFRSHPMGQVFYHFFQYHNRSSFEVFAYSIINNTEANDEFREKIMSDVDHFVDIQKMSFEEAAIKINSDQIDVLIDLAGYTTFSRTQILALRPAPIQMLFMGQPDTSGADFIDYYIADKILVPEENQKYYSEKILYLPNGYFGSPLKISEKKYCKSDFGIKENAFVFCCFCNPYKYEPTLFKAWTDILNQVENSVLWLSPAKTNLYKTNIINFAELNGIDSDRILFAERLPQDLYMARYKICDLFLDTLHYSAGSTAISALMAGLPVLTIKGSRNAENMGASICNSVKMNDLICNSIDHYIAKAVELATSPNLLKSYSNFLKIEHDKLPLFDVKEYVKTFEEALSNLGVLTN